MAILVDGHNLIAHMPGMRLSDSDDEAQLVLLLRRYAARKRGRRVVVVFDHGVYGHPDNLNGYGVECHFARSPRDADSELIRRIRAVRKPGQMQVVTSDRAVAAVAHERRIGVISSAMFARKLHPLPGADAQTPAKPPERPLSESEIEEWLRLFGELPEE